MSPAEVIRFWFDELSCEQWWRKDGAVDAQITTRFGQTHAAAARAELFAWRTTAEGTLL